jgi:orotate phosphoribosyltransferase
MVAIFNYGFDTAKKNFKNANLELTTLSNYSNLLEQALETNFISEKQLKTLKTWKKNPSEWKNIKQI